MIGNVLSIEEIEQTLAYLGVSADAGSYRGIFILLNNTEHAYDSILMKNLDTQRAFLSELLKNNPDDVLFFNTLSPDTIAMVYAEHGCDEQAHAFCAFLHETLKTRFDISSWYFLGVSVDHLAEIHVSFTSAHQMYHFRALTDERYVVVADTHNDRSARFIYTPEDERKLMAYSAVGDMDKIDELLRTLYKQNFSEQSLNVFMIRLLVSNMTITLVKIIDLRSYSADESRHLENLVENIAKSQTPAVVFHHIREAYQFICHISVQRRNEHKQTLFNRIKHHIDSNYTDDSISLQSIAQVFGITPQYLSSFFKELSGENFSLYLERTRIQQANRLLDQNRDTIQSIALKVGYTNVHTFRRAYKRVMGYTPSDYKTAP